MDRDRSYLLNEAVESYLSEQQRFVAMVKEGRKTSVPGEPSATKKWNVWWRMGTRGR